MPTNWARTIGHRWKRRSRKRVKWPRRKIPRRSGRPSANWSRHRRPSARSSTSGPRAAARRAARRTLSRPGRRHEATMMMRSMRSLRSRTTDRCGRESAAATKAPPKTPTHSGNADPHDHGQMNWGRRGESRPCPACRVSQPACEVLPQAIFLRAIFLRAIFLPARGVRRSLRRPVLNAESFPQ